MTYKPLLLVFCLAGCADSDSYPSLHDVPERPVGPDLAAHEKDIQDLEKAHQLSQAPKA